MTLRLGGGKRFQDHGQGLVFFVDDEKSLVQVVCHMLNRMGFDSRGFDSSTAALRAFEENPRAVDLVITDITMPEMSGDVLIGRLLALRSNLPIILCSGLGDSVDRNRAAELGIGAYLCKPFTMGELAETIKSLLKEGPPMDGGA